MAVSDLAALLPLATVLMTVVVLKRGTVAGSLAGIGIGAVLIILVDRYQISARQAGDALGAAGVLSLNAISVIVPGLYFMLILRRQGRLERIVHWVEMLRISPNRKAIILIVGFVPAVESLTGFGVSLLLAVPIFLRLWRSREGLRLSLIGMNIMPWGTLALATVVGASLVDQDPQRLGTATALTSFFVFPTISLLTLWVIGGRAALGDVWFGVTVGFSLSALLFLANLLIRPEIAGVIAGVGAGSLGIALDAHASRERALEQLTGPGRVPPPKAAERADASGAPAGAPTRLLVPYLSVLGIILVIRQVPSVERLLQELVIGHGDVEFAPLLSPGLALFLVAGAMHLMHRTAISVRELLAKCKKPCFSVAAFLLLSQLMLESGMVGALANGVLSYTTSALVLVPLALVLAMVSGFATGSNLGGNALLMPLQAHIGAANDQSLLFLAIQNSGAGHAVFSSIPIIVLVLAILDAEGEGVVAAPVEGELMRFAFGVLVVVFLAILLAAVLSYGLSPLNALLS